MPSGSKKRKAARQKKQQQQHSQASPTNSSGHGDGGGHASHKDSDSSSSSSSSSDSDKDLRQNKNFSESSKTEVVDGKEEAVGGDGDGDGDGPGGIEDVRTVEVVESGKVEGGESEVQWDVKEIGIEESVAASSAVMADVAPVSIGSEGVEVAEAVGEAVETLLDVDSLSHELEVKPVPVFEEAPVSELPQYYESSGIVEKDGVGELSGGVVEKDSVSQLAQSCESGSGVVVEKDSVSELPQSYESGGSGGGVENAPVSELKRSAESGGENSDRYVPTPGVIIEHRARWWNCCGLLDVFMGSRDVERT